MKLSFEEKSVMWIYETTSRQQMIEDIQASLPYVYDTELLNIMNSIISKLEGITNEEFTAIDYEPDAEIYYKDEDE